MLEFNLNQKEESLGKSEETVEDERWKRKRVGDFLSGEGFDLVHQNQELKEAKQINGEWISLWENTLNNQK